MNKTKLNYSIAFSDKRTKYETLKHDYDFHTGIDYQYYLTKDDVIYATKHLKDITADLLKVITAFEKRESNTKSLYYKGTAIYFTYTEKLYYLSYTFYSDYLISQTIKDLQSIGATDILINYGELD